MDSIKKIIYGKGICTAIQKDDILRMAETGSGVVFAGKPPLDEVEKELWGRFSYLRSSGFIQEVAHNTFKITEAGKQFLAEGGYEGLSSWLAAPTGDKLVDAQVEQLNVLKGNVKSAAR